MLPQQQREDRTLFRGNVAVAPRCIALVLRDVGWPRKDKSEACRHHVHDVHGHGSGSNNCLHHSDRSPKAVFSAFIDENRCGSVSTSLDECIQRIKFIGNIEPWTLLLSGDEADLERLRVAWSRRNVRPPSGFVIHGLGDINGIEMQTIPQTQFIPLPDAICGVISELYSSGVKSTRENIKDRLLESYRGMHAPTEAMISESLQILAREKKVGLTGETYQVMVAEVPAIPVIIDPVYASINDEEVSICPHYSQKTSPSSSSSQPATNHSSNFRRSESVQLPKNKEAKLVQKTNFARSSSMRYEGDGKAFVQEIGAKTKANNQLKEKGEKLSLLSRIFGKNKKKREIAQEQVEYSTFSGQFPPPEWQWYENQVQQQNTPQGQEISKSQTWHGFQEPTKEYGLIDYRPPPPYIDSRATPERGEHIPVNGQTLNHKVRTSHVRIQETPNKLTNTPEKHIVSPARTDSHRSAETYSSLPKDKHRSNRRKKRHHSDKRVDPVHHYQNVASCSRIQVQADVHHHVTPPPRSLYGSDISIEYKGRLPMKNSMYALSKDSGVNCIGRKQSHGLSADRAKYYKRRSCPPMSNTIVLEENCGQDAGKPAVIGSDKDTHSDKEKPKKICSCDGKCTGHEGRILSDSGINSARNTDISDAKNTDRSSDKHLQGSDNHRKKYTELVRNRSCELERISDNMSVNTSHERLPDTSNNSTKCDKLLTASERYPSYGTVIEVVKEELGNAVQCTHVHLVEKRPFTKEDDVENRDNLPECDMLDHSCHRNSKHLLCPQHAHKHYIDSQHGHAHNNNNNTIISGHTCWIQAQMPRMDNVQLGHPDKRASCGHVPYYETNLDDDASLRLSYNSLTQAQMETLSSDAQRLGFIGDYKVVGFV